MEGPRVKIDMTTEQEVLVERDGHAVKTRVPTKTIDPGGILVYVINLENEGDSRATNVVVNNPVPDGATYVLGSAAGKGSRPLVSLDHGEHFTAERKLSRLEPENVTDVRWMVDNMPPGSKRMLEFKVKVESREARSIARYWMAFYLWLVAMFSR